MNKCIGYCLLVIPEIYLFCDKNRSPLLLITISTSQRPTKTTFSQSSTIHLKWNTERHRAHGYKLCVFGITLKIYQCSSAEMERDPLSHIFSCTCPIAFCTQISIVCGSRVSVVAWIWNEIYTIYIYVFCLWIQFILLSKFYAKKREGSALSTGWRILLLISRYVSNILLLYAKQINTAFHIAGSHFPDKSK